MIDDTCCTDNTHNSESASSIKMRVKDWIKGLAVMLMLDSQTRRCDVNPET